MYILAHLHKYQSTLPISKSFVVGEKQANNCPRRLYIASVQFIFCFVSLSRRFLINHSQSKKEISNDTENATALKGEQKQYQKIRRHFRKADLTLSMNVIRALFKDELRQYTLTQI